MTVAELYVLFGLKPDKSWKDGMGLLGKLRSAAAGVVAVSSLRALSGFISDAAESATHLVSMSQAMGLTIQQTQEWGYVAEQSGSNMKELSVGMSMFIGNLRKIANGTASKQLRRTFSEMHIDAGQAKAALAGPEGLNAVLLHTADQFKALGSNGNRAGLGRALFGAKAGRAMVADMAQGADAIKKLMERRRAMGELDEKQAESLKKLGNASKDLKKSLHALADQALAKIAPKLIDLAERALAWIEANGPMITEVLSTVFDAFAGGLEMIGGAITALQDLFNDAMNGDNGAIAILAGLAAVVLAVVVPALWMMAAPIVSAMIPLLAIAAIVAALTYAVLEFGPDIMKALGDSWTYIKRKAQDFWDWLAGIPDDIIDGITGFVQHIEDAFSAMWEEVKKLSKDAMDWISEQARKIPVLGWIGEKIGQGAGAIANAATGNTHLDAIDDIRTAPSVNARSSAGGGGPVNVTQGPTTVQIQVGTPKEAKDAYDRFKDDRDDRANRHALRDVGGEVR